METDTLWITSASLSSTTSSRASSTSTPLAKRQRSCSETALVSRLPTALHHSFLSLSPCLHLSPHPMASCSCLPLSPGASAPSCSNVQGTAAQPRRERFGLFFQGTALPLICGEGGGTSKRVMCLVRSRGGSSGTPLPACHWEMVPPVHPPSMLRAGASSSASSYST